MSKLRIVVEQADEATRRDHSEMFAASKCKTYKTFTARVPKQQTTKAVTWLKFATGDSRPVLEFVLLDDDAAVTSDGRRLFFAPRNEFDQPNGLYAVNGSKLRPEEHPHNYPDYNAVVPKKSKPVAHVTVTCADLWRAMTALKVFARDTEGVTRVTVGENELTIRAKSDNGDGAVKVTANVTGGLKAAVGLNYKFILDSISAYAPGNQVTLAFYGTTKAVIVKSDGSERWSLIMPMLLKS